MARPIVALLVLQGVLPALTLNSITLTLVYATRVQAVTRRPTLDILYEDNHVLVVNKPAMLATMGVQQDSLVQQTKQYLKDHYHKPGNVYLGVVSRLDSVVSGVIVLARTSKAAERLNRQFRERTVAKTYFAVVSGVGELPLGTYTDWLRKNERAHAMEICREKDHGAQLARLDLVTSRYAAPLQLLEIRLHTGRKHQIRVQLGARRHSVVGDRKYGSVVRFSPGIALHARSLTFQHPVRHEPLQFTAPWPASWRSRFQELLANDTPTSP